MKLKAKKLSVIILLLAFFVSCKTISDALEFPIELGLLPVGNKDLLDLQKGIFAYRKSYNSWPPDSAALRNYLSIDDTLTFSFANYKNFSLKVNEDTLRTHYYLHYASDSLKYRMIEGTVRMILLTNDTVDIKHYLDRMETTDGKVVTLPDGYWLWTKKQNAP